MVSVAIIGAGVAGLACAKSALEYGLEPTVFERAGEPGGLWRPASGSVWPALTTNISRYTCVFSDHAWPPDTPEFPAAPAVAQYLLSYARRFDLTALIKAWCEVTSLAADGAGWKVGWTHRGQRFSRQFDAAIVASGYFAQPIVPALDGRFDGISLHSGSYRGAGQLGGRRVVVVGMAFSGSEIAAELALAGSQVTGVASRPFWLLPKLVGPARIPLDLYSKTRAARRLASAAPAAEAPAAERHRNRNRLLSELGANPGEFDESLALDPDSADPPHVVVSDALSAPALPPDLSIVSGRVSRLDDSSVVLADGRRLPADAIVWGTGYRPELSFLSGEVRRSVEYAPADLLQPLILVDGVFPAGIEGLSFVGMYRGPYFSGIELQARWACAVIAGVLPPPSTSESEQAINAARGLRAQRPRPQFPYDDLQLADRIGRRLGVLPTEDSDSGEWYWNLPVVPAHYRMLGPHSSPDFARGQITEAVDRCRS
ncbi:MAG TPA: FAD-dependent oxidoreductase [Streptosporangiaceae bacterium]|nr:FAD-dependent oxidoreductase [Streptosporangiaceae bacterium]